jgi:transposase-like protein
MARRIRETTRRWSTHQGREAVVAWQQSGLTQAEFCRQHGIHVQRLIFWRNKLKLENSQRHFIEAAITGGAAEPAIVVKLRGGEQLEIEDPHRVDATWLIELVLGLSEGARQ